MRNLPKSWIVLFCLFLSIGVLNAEEAPDPFSADTFFAKVSAALGHDLDKGEHAVANATYLWYYAKFDERWEAPKFDFAVEKAAKNCGSKAMLLAAKAGQNGEKLLKALIVAAGDASESFSRWVDKNSARYDQTH